MEYRKNNEPYNGRYIVVDEQMILNPSEETLLANGYEPLSEEEIKKREFQEAVMAKLGELEQYAQSPEVNTISFKGMSIWLTPSERSHYSVSIRAAEELGEKQIIFAIGGQAVTLDIPTAHICLAKIQRYADATFMVTTMHKANIVKLTTLEEVQAYNFKQGYPDKLTLG